MKEENLDSLNELRYERNNAAIALAEAYLALEFRRAVDPESDHPLQKERLKNAYKAYDFARDKLVEALEEYNYCDACDKCKTHDLY